MDTDLIEVTLSKSDLAMIYLSLMHRHTEYATEGHPEADRCNELVNLFASAQKRNQVGILFAEKQKCDWKLDFDTGAWQGDCGIVWIFGDGTPEENEAFFCPQCGRPLEVRGEEPFGEEE